MIKIEGADLMVQKIGKIKDLTRAKKAVRQSGTQLTAEMKRKAVFTRGYSTGRTKQSIDMQIKDGGLSAVVGPHTHYAIYLEYGTRYMSPQPFVRPALNVIAPHFLKEVARCVFK